VTNDLRGAETTGALAPGEMKTEWLLKKIPADLRSLGAGSISLFFAFSVVNLSNLTFHILVSRLIGPNGYGQLAALLSVVLIVSVPVGIFQTIAAKRVSVLRAAGDEQLSGEMLKSMARTLTLIGAIGMVILLMLAPLLAIFLRMPLGPVTLIGPYVLVSLLTGLGYGALQGALRFAALSFAVVTGVLFRLALGIGLAHAGFGVSGAMVATVAGAALSGALALGLARMVQGVRIRRRLDLEPFRRDFRTALLALGVFALLSQFDVVLARHYLDATEAGLYSGAALIARALFFVPGVVAMVAFPRFAEVKGSGPAARRWLKLSTLAVIAIVGAMLPVVILWRDLIVSVALSKSFEGSSSLVPLLSTAMGAMALVSLLTYFHVAAETHAYRLVAVALATETALIAILHASGSEIATILLVTAVATAFLLYRAARAATMRPAGDAIAQQLATNGHALDVSIVLPCHNPGDALRGVLSELCGNLLDPLSYEVIVVSDGSTDNTVAIAQSFAPHVRVIERENRDGKGNALRAGLAEARGRYVAFIDSDGDIHPRDLRPFVTLMDMYHPDVVLASKRHPLSEVSYPATRRLMSWTYHKLGRILFRVNVRDTQTGLKMIRRDVLAAVLPRMLEKRYAFDLEFLVVARLLGFKRIFEAPVRIDFKFESGVNIRQTLRIVLDTLAIFYRRYLLGTYHLNARTGEPIESGAHPTPAMSIEVDTAQVGAQVLAGDVAADLRG
jgi:O-antigen/teichoic acid export membrane protein